MKPQRNKPQIASEEFQDAIILDLNPPEPPMQSSEITRICWNTGEEKNCPACYLSKGCKAR